jgi:hypothetical protein
MLKTLVTSLELSRQLQEVGCPPETVFVWLETDGVWSLWEGNPLASDPEQAARSCRAYTAEELLRLLPFEVRRRLYMTVTDETNRYYLQVTDDDDRDVVAASHDPSLADAAGKLYLALKERGRV